MNANHCGTLKIVYGRVDIFTNNLNHIFGIKGQFANLGDKSFLIFNKSKYIATCMVYKINFIDHKYCCLCIREPI